MKAIVIVSGCAIAATLLSGCNSKTATDVELTRLMHSMDFVSVVPPTTDYGPGNFVARVHYDPTDADPYKVSLTYLCDPRYSVMQYSDPPLSADSEVWAIKSQIGGTFSVDASYLKLLNLNLSANFAKSVSVTLDNVKVLQYAEDSLAAIRDKLVPYCVNSINMNIDKNDAYQIQESFMASVVLNIAFDSKLDVKAKLAIAKELAGFSLDGTAVELDNQNATSVSGRALIYGLRWEKLDVRLPYGHPVASQ